MKATRHLPATGLAALQLLAQKRKYENVTICITTMHHPANKHD